MTENIAVSIQNVCKKYRLFASPHERVKEALHPFRKQYHKEFWALKGVSFDVLKGQTLGILGRNGSGKSTLLQIIASVLHPTTGSLEVSGRVSALLELGAGFNPEFTGRDNVILNGAIQGVPRDEMISRMPEIEAFADIGDFFDQPVKIYSSGMFVRVAFASAINVDPDILIVDEALSVGDAKFQNKCFQKFHEFQAQKKTIILVTHAIETVTRLCDCAVLLQHGKVVKLGSPNEVANIYFDMLFSDGNQIIQSTQIVQKTSWKYS
jgi:lipopolysaccharide transport system ATP-binding protein